MTPVFAFLSGPEIAVLVGIAVLLFGAERIPKLARSMGQAKKEFESAQRGETAASAASSASASSADSSSAAATQPQAPAPTQPPPAQPS